MLVSIPLNARTPTLPYEEPKIETKEDLPEVLLKIAECESGNRQFDDAGAVIRGRANPLDRGRFQINTYWHGEEAEKRGIDLNTWEGNTQFALILYERNGTRDWGWSAWCWNP